jgi:prepilin-type N-terminal cleavage/methylation domain-containing protein
MLRKNAGFTLIEIAIVIAIIGAAMVGIYATVGPALESSRISNTNKKIDRIELALLAYVMQNGCLPCPADGSLDSTSSNAGWSHSSAAYYGPSGPTNSPCAGSGGCTAFGTANVVPWRSLGLTENEILDAWNDRISYAVTSALCTTAMSSMVRVPPASYPAGTLSVKNNSGVSQTSTAAYVLISYGPDRNFAYAGSKGSYIVLDSSIVSSDPQGVNSSSLGDGSHFRQDTLSNISGSSSYFDDVVRFRNAGTVIQNCGPNACGNPA